MSIRQGELPTVDPSLAQHGAWMSSYSPVPIKGTIVDINPATGNCLVKTEFGNYLPNVAMPNMHQDPDGGGGKLENARRGQDVIVQFGLGHPYIIQYATTSTDIDLGADVPAAFDLTEIAATGNPFPPSDAANFLGRLPKDSYPGDWARIGNQGQTLAVLDGGVAMMKSGPWAQIRTISTPEDDVTQIFGRNLDLYSGFGHLQFGHVGGKSWMKLEGGTDQLTESGLNPGNWTTRLLFGGEAQGLASFQLRDRNAVTVFENNIGYDGTVQKFTKGNFEETISGTFTQHKENGAVETITGDSTFEVLNGDRMESVEGSQTTQVSINQNEYCGGDRTIVAERDIALFAGRKIEMNASGNGLLAKPGDVAARMNITNGDLVMDIGNPASLDLQKSLSGFKSTVYGGGDFIFWNLRPPGRFIVNANGPDCVALGALPVTNVAVFHAMLFEMFQALMAGVIGWADSHIHINGAGPTSTAMPPLSPIANPLIPPCKSNFVAIGG